MSRISYLRKPFEDEAGMVLLSREERSLKPQASFPSTLGKACVFS